MSATSVKRAARSIEQEAVARGVPAAVASDARRAVERRFGGGAYARARLEAYFWGVVRSRALRGEASRVRQWLVAGSFVDEMRAAGHSPERAYEELRRACAGMVDATVIEAFAPASVA